MKDFLLVLVVSEIGFIEKSESGIKLNTLVVLCVMLSFQNPDVYCLLFPFRQVTLGWAGVSVRWSQGKIFVA